MIEMAQEIFVQKRTTVMALVALLLTAVALSSFDRFYLAPQASEAQNKWSKLRGQVAAAGKNDASSIYGQGRTDLTTLKSHIPARRDFPVLIGKIREMAAASNVTTGDITYKPATVKEVSLLSYSVSLAASGSYAAVKSFLSDIMGMKELLVIESVTFSNSDMFADHVSMDLKLTLYLQEGT